MMRDIWAGALSGLFRKKLHTILTISGIAVGVMMVVIVSLVGNAGKAVVNTEIPITVTVQE